ncbi:MAG: hypothetical protein ABI597_13365 [Gammaproteobacteria bacterium]
MIFQKKIALACASILTLTSVDACAAQTTMRPTTNYINNLDAVLKNAKNNSNMSVIFPAEVPTSHVKLYASETSRSDFWAIYIDSTADCNGAHFCNVGYIMAQNKGKIEQIYFDMKTHTKIKKQSIMLADGLPAVYTPGHAEGDWHNPSLEWKLDDVAYMLTWQNGVNIKKALVTMANSAMHPGSN